MATLYTTPTTASIFRATNVAKGINCDQYARLYSFCCTITECAWEALRGCLVYSCAARYAFHPPPGHGMMGACASGAVTVFSLMRFIRQ